MKKFLKLILVVVLAASMLLCSCNDTSEDDLFGDVTTAKKPQATQATTAEPVQQTKPTNLVPEFYEMNEALSRLTNKPVVTEIGDTGVEIELSYQAWPTICRGEGSTLYAVSSLRRNHIDPFAATCFYVSHDNGETWSEPRIINNSPIDDRDTGVVYIGNGKMLVSYFTISAQDFLPGGGYETQWGGCTEEQKNAKKREWNSYSAAELQNFHGSFVLVSDDYGETWSERIRIPISCPHGPSLAQDGRTLLYAGLQGNNFVTYTSRDFGRTWAQYSQVALPKLADNNWGYWEPYVIQLSNGSYVGAIRTGTTGGKDKDGNEYIGNKTLGVLTTTSYDGKNWTNPTRVPNMSGAPAHFLELDNGVVLMTYSYRLKEANGGTGVIGCRGRLSYDDGVTWSEEEIIISECRSTKNSDLGYPSTVQLDDGTLITIYYQPYDDDKPASVLYTKWRLNEVEE